MAADANLIKSAATAYGAGTAAKLAGGDPLGDMATGLIERVDAQTADVKLKTEQAKQRDREKDDKFNENMEAALQQGGALGVAEYDFTKRKVDKLKEEYEKCTLGDDACRQKVMMALSKESQGLTSMKDTRALNADSMKTLRGDVSREQREVMGIYANSQSGKYSLVEGEDGELRYTFDLGEGKEASYTKSELDKMFEQQKDSVGAQATSERALSNIQRGINGEPFNESEESAQFENLTKTDNALRSFLNDDWGVGTFAGSIDNKIKAEVGQLGPGSGRTTFALEMKDRGIMIPAEKGEDNWYDNISDEDIKAIKAKLMNPQTEQEIAISRQVAKEYFVDAQRQQHEKGVKQAEDAAKAAQAKQDNLNLNKYLDRRSREKIASMKANEKKEKSVQLANDINNVVSLGADATEADFSALDGLTRVNAKSGELGMYIRKNPDPGKDGFVIYAGDPAQNENASIISALSDEPNVRAQELFNLYGISTEYLDVGEIDYSKYEKNDTKPVTNWKTEF
tara:strand:+ start:192 stop:1727 length:1536 start_codon:yes stop_codon:yes gene_type:complete